MIVTKNSDMETRLPSILKRIREAGGAVVRYTGGIWSYPGAKTVAPGKLEWHTTTPFVEELVLSQHMEWTDFHGEGKVKLPRGARLKRVMAEDGA
jgi:hypothetical protein